MSGGLHAAKRSGTKGCGADGGSAWLYTDHRRCGKCKTCEIRTEKQTFDYGNYKKLEITLAGKFQVANAVLALEAVQALEKCGYEIKETAIRKA